MKPIHNIIHERYLNHPSIQSIHYQKPFEEFPATTIIIHKNKQFVSDDSQAAPVPLVIETWINYNQTTLFVASDLYIGLGQHISLADPELIHKALDTLDQWLNETGLGGPCG